MEKYINCNSLTMKEFDFYWMIKMKNKKISFSIALLLLFSMAFSMLVSVKADYGYDYDNTYFEYDVSEGDSFEYNMNFVFNFTADSSFYDEMDTWLEAEDIISADFSSEAFMNDLEEFLVVDYKIQYELTEMYSEIYNWTDSSDDSTYTQYYDIFNASVRADLNEGNGWETPEIVSVAKLEDAKDFMVNYMNDTEYEYFEEEIDDMIDMLEDPAFQPDWDNMQIYQVSSNGIWYYENGTVMEYELTELSDGTLEPENPFPEFGGIDGLPIFLPSEMNFEEMYDYATDMFEFDLLYNLDEGNPIDPFNTSSTLQTVLADAGVSQIYVDEKSVGIVWNVGEIDPDLLEEAYGEEFEDELAEAGIDDYSGTVVMAVEYDNDWALETFAVYVHVGITLDTTAIEGAPDLNNEEISFDITYTIAQDGVNPPTEDEIINGKIGENSPFSIPGFPIWLVGLFGIISIAALVVKHRK